MRLALIALVAAAAVPQPHEPQSAIPVVVRDTVKLGTYDLEITTDDGTLVGALVVKRDTSGYVATIDAGGRKPAVKSFMRRADTYVLTGGHGDFVVTYTLTFKADSVHGAFEGSGGMQGKVAGAYKR